MIEELNKKICEKFGIRHYVLGSMTCMGMIAGVYTLYPNLCKGNNLKHLIQIINEHKVTHKINYDGDTEKLLTKISKMRLTPTTLDKIKASVKDYEWEY